VTVYKARLLHSFIQAFSNVLYLVHPGCPAVLSQSHRIRQLAVKTYAEGVTECAASIAIQPICLARGAIPSTQLQVSLRAFNQHATFSESHLCCSLHGLTDRHAFASTPLHLAVQYVHMHLLGNCVSASVAKVQTVLPIESALPGCDAQWDWPPVDQVHQLIECRACRLTGPAESVSLTQLGHRDTGLSRLFLWWVWNQGLPALQQHLKPRVRQSHRAYLEQKIAAFQRWLCSLLHIESEAGELHYHLSQVQSTIQLT